MSRDHLADAINAADQGDISNSLAHSSIASVQTLRAIESRLGEIVKLGTAGVGVLLDSQDVEEGAAVVDEPVPFTPVADPAAARAYRIQQLGDHLQATYDAATTAPVWPILAEAAIDWMEK